MKENHKQGADGLLTDGVRTYPVSPLDFDTYDEASFRLSPAVDFLDIVINFQVVDRASIRDTDENTEGAEVD